MPDQFANHLENLGTTENSITVVLTNELVELLSGQLYKSPLKAIEELVVNSYDAGAETCYLYVPSAADQKANNDKSFVAVFDDGGGMDHRGLSDLWRIGQSSKRGVDLEVRKKRKVIGKFGIGKLATHTIAHRLTYISKTNAGIFTVTTDYRKFNPGGSQTSTPVQLPVRRIADASVLLSDSALTRIMNIGGISKSLLQRPSWTFAILEELKPKAQTIQLGRLRRVLETAMPLGTQFRVLLNGNVVESAKEDYVKLVDFAPSQLPPERLKTLGKSTKQTWTVVGDRLVSELFKEGITGRIIVTERSLAGKSDDLLRSHGFFVRVRGRLVNEDDPNFGITSAYGTMNRFRADLNIDDLNSVLTASREGIEESEVSSVLEKLLIEIFNEARGRYDKALDDLKKEADRKNESHRNYVSPRFVEFPMADALASPSARETGAEPDNTWFYLDVSAVQDIAQLIQRLYQHPRTKYRYNYSQNGKTARLVMFNPTTSTFEINTDHDFARAHIDEPRARLLLEDFVTTETMLEVYLREASVSPNVIGQILERRDGLFRSLALDHPFSLGGLADSLLDSAANERDLEINLVGAARALGFVAKHVSGEGEPDGVAEFTDYPGGSRRITLEAKSSKDVPSLGALDFAGLYQHMKDYEADGCLLVAPSYPGKSREDDSAAAKRAKDLGISCWTVQQIADFVRAVEMRHLSARDLLSIVLKNFTPDDVGRAVQQMLSASAWTMPELFTAIVGVFREFEDRLPDAARTISAIAFAVSRLPEFKKIKQEQVKSAIISLSEISKGAMTVRDDNVILHVSTAELERRVSGLTNQVGEARRESNFREGPPRAGQ